MKNLANNLIMKAEDNYLAMLKIAHFIGKEGVSFKKFEKLCELVFGIINNE